MPRPDYPFNDQLPVGYSRHHIIPWRETHDAAVAHFTTGPRLDTLFAAYHQIGQANLGEYANANALRDGILANGSPALETFAELATWLPGNLVVGPAARDDDPGEAFDTVACGYALETNDDYQGLQARWAAQNVAGRAAIIITLAGLTSLAPDEWQA